MSFTIRQSKLIRKKLKQWQRTGNKRMIAAFTGAVDLLAVYNAPARFVLREDWKDHQLQGRLASHRDVHLDFDQILVYRVYEAENLIDLIAILTHEELKKLKQ